MNMDLHSTEENGRTFRNSCKININKYIMKYKYYVNIKSICLYMCMHQSCASVQSRLGQCEFFKYITKIDLTKNLS